MATWRKVVLFGDSLVQYSFQSCGFGSAIATEFQRMADILNRGFEGYCTDNAVDVMKEVFPSGSINPTDVVVVLFGANDSSLPEFPQHVCLEKYSTNLQKIIHYLGELGLSASNILVVSPPAVEVEMWSSFLKSVGRGIVCEKDNKVVETYAKACGKVAIKNSCSFVDLWEGFMNSEESLNNLLTDGLHLSQKGNRLVANLLLPHLIKMTENWEKFYPDWSNFYETYTHQR